MTYQKTFDLLSVASMSSWAESLPESILNGFDEGRWGDLPRWRRAVEGLPEMENISVDLNQPYITIDGRTQMEELEKHLRLLHPWRKGPYQIGGLPIETEWRSDLKWDRLADHITSLQGRTCLDLGCGNGYHLWRMRGAGVELAIGIDSTVLFVMQFLAVQNYIQDPHTAVFPLGIDDLPENALRFDTVFSMGLLYHRRSPLDHLLQLKNCLREGGECVLETIVIEGEKGKILNPQGRYAKMPNVFFIPTPLTLESWLLKMGFVNVQCVDVTTTTVEEQRSTSWMGFQSLPDFLDPQNKTLTVEGYPAPRRAVFTAQKPC